MRKWLSAVPRGPHGVSVRQRFWRFVSPEPNTGCWLWLGGVSTGGYARFNVRRASGRGSMLNANRLTWAYAGNRAPRAGQILCHRCDQPLCVNPDHLFVGTHHDNMVDMWRKGRGGYRGSPGTDHPMAKLTEAQVRELRARAKAGVRTRVLAADYGIARTYANEIIKGGVWRCCLSEPAMFPGVA